MDWKELGRRIAQLGLPLLGSALPIPGGAAIGTALAAAIGTDAEPEKILARLTESSEAVLKARQFEVLHAEAMLKMQIEAEVAATQAINQTMQAEARSEHWPQYSWRPAIGFSVAVAVVLSVLTVFAAYGSVIFLQRAEGLQHLPGILAAVAGIIGVVSPILGIASWFRGKAKLESQ